MNDGIMLFLSFIGGLALFLYGMNVMGDGLSKLSGGKLEMILEKLTSTPLKGVLLGCGVTAIIQSSSATTVMVVGFVNSGIMKLSQAISIIMGANIGTTVTSWILSLSGLEGDGLVIQLLKPSNFAPILALVGVILIMFVKGEKKKDVGIILAGFAILMIGMDTMSGAVEPLKNVPEFTNLMIKFSDTPVLGLLAGLILTAIIQSSSASVGILQAFCKTGVLKFSAALPVIMGQNIGTCVTALLSAIGAKKNAKRAAVVHLMFNILGTVLFMIVFYTINAINPFEFLGEKATEVGIARLHTIFNVCATLALVWFSKGLEKLACLIVKDGPEDKEEVDTVLQVLDDRFLSNPSLAMEHAKDVAVEMAKVSKDVLIDAIELVGNYNKEKFQEILDKEHRIDTFEDKIGTYLLKLSSRDLSEEDSKKLTLCLHLIGDFERISDHAVNIAQSAKEMNKKELLFSDKAVAELKVFSDLLIDTMDTAVLSFVNDDVDLATNVEPMEEVADKLNKQIKKRHVKRLRKGKCTIEMGFVLSDITTNFERIADHCSNIAVGVIQTREESYESHEYLDNLDKGENTIFRDKYVSYKERYVLP